MGSGILVFSAIMLICAIVASCIKGETAQQVSTGLFRVCLISLLVGIGLAAST